MSTRPKYSFEWERVYCTCKGTLTNFEVIWAGTLYTKNEIPAKVFDYCRTFLYCCICFFFLDLHVVLLNDLLVLLQQNDNGKFTLKNHNTGAIGSTGDNKVYRMIFYNPIMLSVIIKEARAVICWILYSLCIANLRYKNFFSFLPIESLILLYLFFLLWCFRVTVLLSD